MQTLAASHFSSNISCKDVRLEADTAALQSASARVSLNLFKTHMHQKTPLAQTFFFKFFPVRDLKQKENKNGVASQADCSLLKAKRGEKANQATFST